MKKLYILFLIFNVTSTYLFSQENLKIPPGTIFLKDNLFIDKVPVNNLMFLEYLTAKHFIRKKGFESFADLHNSTDKKFDRVRLLYPSFLKNLNKKGSLLTRKNYFENYKYKYSPVLNVTKKQAIDYCNWRTEMVLYLWSNENENVNYKINYRLPQESEMILAKEYFSKGNKFKLIDGENPTKFKTMNIEKNFVLYNISEFTMSEIVFGENWKNITPNEFPNDITGFRCVCEIQP
ncbi:sulfatase-modifying factor enzyme 1 [Gillisia mitskevichiae]|uniref:Sulfatase-modifying factor enzyme 1 n=1 Tax=Gillisia mitskevichiae TaxID=270921 RepID=A0A495NYC5_9FLAO|nr:SUMF1/EgtB/PvdO family nonheme iron enzyme [Gillisia mitskevichiae]RKS42765.1 sulfatase-modifying factor enzyme 1 [Gillisia mitskevichiae]